MRPLSPFLLPAGSAVLPLRGAATAVSFLVRLVPGDPVAAILLVVLATNDPGDALVERLAARRPAR